MLAPYSGPGRNVASSVDTAGRRNRGPLPRSTFGAGLGSQSAMTARAPAPAPCG
jgi:hypothetical protein